MDTTARNQAHRASLRFAPSGVLAQGEASDGSQKCKSTFESSALGRKPASGEKRIAIVQSAYIPWRGFFDMIGRCTEYVIFDQVQFAKRHWHNRNCIKTASGVHWLTIPVLSKSRFEQPIDQVQIAEPWAEKHWRGIELAYRRAPYFETTSSFLRPLYERAATERRLTDVNELFLCALSQRLGLKTSISRDTQYPAVGAKSERLLSICLAAGATHYISGPSAKDYLREEMFAEHGIAVEWMDYSDYPAYSQLHGPFEPFVSVIDLLFNLGEDTPRFLGVWSESVQA
ncbi:WbqC family protein [Microvirga lenta]|uniref:WbqC family protein n=1 Tax=Microvirga lenta TaxID=2881337 RepID=UPI001CFF70EF|nr:WbqC family protein [Microvirga lenta]MCB5175190.1 WbqC family protein [Microvirga lenta]